MNAEELGKLEGHAGILGRLSQTLRVKAAILAGFPYKSSDGVPDTPFVGGLVKVLRLSTVADVATSIANLAWDAGPHCPSVAQLLDKCDKGRREHPTPPDLEDKLDAVRDEMDCFSKKYRVFLKGLRDRLVGHFHVGKEDGKYQLRTDYLDGEERPSDVITAAKAFLPIVQLLHDAILHAGPLYEYPTEVDLDQAARALWASFPPLAGAAPTTLPGT